MYINLSDIIIDVLMLVRPEPICCYKVDTFLHKFNDINKFLFHFSENRTT